MRVKRQRSRAVRLMVSWEPPKFKEMLDVLMRLMLLLRMREREYGAAAVLPAALGDVMDKVVIFEMNEVYAKLGELQ